MGNSIFLIYSDKPILSVSSREIPNEPPEIKNGSEHGCSLGERVACCIRSFKPWGIGSRRGRAIEKCDRLAENK